MDVMNFLQGVRALTKRARKGDSHAQSILWRKLAPTFDRLGHQSASRIKDSHPWLSEEELAARESRRLWLNYLRPNLAAGMAHSWQETVVGC